MDEWLDQGHNKASTIVLHVGFNIVKDFRLLIIPSRSSRIFDINDWIISYTAWCTSYNLLNHHTMFIMHIYVCVC